MAATKATRPPSAENIQPSVPEPMSIAWLNYLTSLADRADAAEARLAVGEARLLAIETRLAAAGIP